MLAGLLLLGSSPGYAQDDPGAVAADRPGFGDGAAVVDPGRFQVEAGVAVAWTETARQHSIGQVLLRLGVLPRVELRAALNSYVVVRQDIACPFASEVCDESRQIDGFEDVLLGAKVRLLQGKRIGKPTLTAIVGIGIPTGDDAFSTGDVRPEVKLALDLPLTDRIAFSGNGGYAFTPEDNLADDFFTYASLSVSLPGVEGLGLFAGIHSIFPEDFDPKHGLDGGVTYLLDPATQLDLNLGVGLTGDEPDFAVGVGVARRF